MFNVERAFPSSVYLPLRLFLNRLRGRTEIDVSLVKNLVQPGSLVADVGAHKGLYTVPLYRRGCIVYAFEPNQHCAMLLERWAKGKKSVYVVRAGLSDKSGFGKLKIPVDQNGKSHIASASLEKQPEGKFIEEEIALSKLDDFNFVDLKFLKLDVEGLEDRVVLGGIETIKRCRPIMLIEVERRHRSKPISVIFNMLFDLDYCAFYHSVSGLKEVRDADFLGWENLEINRLSKNFWFIQKSDKNNLLSLV